MMLICLCMPSSYHAASIWSKGRTRVFSCEQLEHLLSQAPFRGFRGFRGGAPSAEPQPSRDLMA
jgi:hypothetical protein